jgi:hypothetical protein
MIATSKIGNGAHAGPGKFHRLLNKQFADHMKDFNIQQH